MPTMAALLYLEAAQPVAACATERRMFHGSSHVSAYSVRMLVITRAKLGMVGRGMDGELTTCPVGNTDTHIHRKDLEDTLVSKFPHIG